MPHNNGQLSLLDGCLGLIEAFMEMDFHGMVVWPGLTIRIIALDDWCDFSLLAAL